ncbi:CDGSH iron-sulfur domain-containing protein [Methanobrevibacter cuticularis]|uniref:CDGSH iron-sulfur domain-containing protein n=1 Tax=Methanobrevibacter cuticularis TaxID=47311 RepID=UPI00082E88CB|nr:CDGSH iron-sulfur domain-containing protein [Methanobrevibacter cuticularis]
MKIKVTKNGPYIIMGNVPLYKEDIIIDNNGFPIKFGNKEKIDTEETYALCRCGKSKNKPFCDGTHEKIAFEGKEIANTHIYEESVEIFETDNLKLIDAPTLCDHSRFCTRAGGIRHLMEEGDEKSEKIAIDEAKSCPSGRLTMIKKSNDESSESDFDKEIVLLYDTGKETKGPIWVKGGINLESSTGEEYENRNRMTLCRCGKSHNKPFCDGSHWADEEFQEKFRKKWNLSQLSYNRLD